MNLKALTKSELDGRIKHLAKAERELLHEVILTIKEIDSRRMYLDFGFPSLYEYLVEEVQYLGGSAQRRIDAARLLKDLPQVGEKIKTGEINLGQITLLQKAVRKVQRMQSKKVTAEQKMILVNQIANMNQPDSEKEVLAFFDLPVVKSSKISVQADGSVRIEMTLSADAFKKSQKAQELLSHAVPTQDVGELFEYLIDKVIKQKTGVRSEPQVKTSSSKKIAPDSRTTATVAVKALSTSVRKKVLNKQGCCQYKSPITGRVCQSKWFSQTDHKQSKWAGGADVVENLQVLCASHNQIKYRKEAGIRYRS